MKQKSHICTFGDNPSRGSGYVQWVINEAINILYLLKFFLIKTKLNFKISSIFYFLITGG